MEFCIDYDGIILYQNKTNNVFRAEVTERLIFVMDESTFIENMPPNHDEEDTRSVLVSDKYNLTIKGCVIRIKRKNDLYVFLSREYEDMNMYHRKHFIYILNKGQHNSIIYDSRVSDESVRDIGILSNNTVCILVNDGSRSDRSYIDFWCYLQCSETYELLNSFAFYSMHLFQWITCTNDRIVIGSRNTTYQHYFDD